jgi:hypothetical protein
MKMIEAIKVNKELMMKGFWAGIGFWTASEIIYNSVTFVKVVMGMEV